jgi:hypothetical protein
MFDAASNALDGNVPLLLLPVRLETRFELSADRSRERALLVRIHPDVVHADTHVRGLTSTETALGQLFWKEVWPAGISREQQNVAFAGLASRLGPFRAAWTAEATRPLNWNSRGTAKAPEFGDAPQRTRAERGTARLLPDHWVLVCYQNEDLVFVEPGKSIPRDVPISPDILGVPRGKKTAPDWLDAQGLGWQRTFAAAETIGMAIRVTLAPSLSLEQPLDLFAFGVRTGDGPTNVAQQLSELLAAHQWSHGVDFVRRGTPTNNSGRASSGVSLDEPDTDTLLETILTQPGAAGLKPQPLFRRPFGAASASALGLAADSILERVPLRDDRQLDLAAAMSAALWPATWGSFLRTMIARAVTDPWIDWARTHVIANVRGGGLLPVIRLGDQPYALHPVALEKKRPGSSSKIDRLENLLLDLLPAWDDAVTKRVARLDVDPQDASLGDATATLARILGATPNPSDLMLTPLTNQVDLYELRWILLLFLMDLALSQRFATISQDLAASLAAASTLEAQIASLESVIAPGDGTTPYPRGPLWYEAHASANDEPTRQAAQEAIDLIKAYTLPLLYNHRERSRPLLERNPDRGRVTALMADDGDPPLFFGLFGETPERVPWTGPLVSRDRDAQDDVRTWLDALVTEALDSTQPAAFPGAHAPLLFQLLKQAIARVHDDDRADMLAGLETLAAAARDGRLPDPIADLETLMGEVLGTAMHRIDAWLSAGAADRLASLRRSHPRGVEVGGYGWVLGLKPSASRPSQGFIHAPTLDHAATAGILRSGWSTLDVGALGVDASSGRVRTASWVLDGMRDGYPLTELLGQSLERRLHDSHLDRWVDDLRKGVLAATPHPDQRPSAIVDGLIVARAWLGTDGVSALTDEESTVHHALHHLLREAGADEPALRDAFNEHAAVFDAVTDAGLFASVHAVVQRRPERASAIFEAIGRGTAAPPQLDAFRTTRAGRRVSHRVVLFLDPTSAASTISPYAIAEPALERWLQDTLPLDQIGFGVWTEENGVKSWQGPLTLQDAGIGHLDLLGAVPAVDPLPSDSALARRLIWRFAREAAGAGRIVTITVDPDLAGGDASGRVPLALAIAALRSLRALTHSSRALRDADVTVTSSTGSTVDAATLLAREATLTAAARSATDRLRTAIDSPASTAELLDACAAFAAWHIDGAIPLAGLRDLATGDDPTDRDALRAEAEAVFSRMQARVTARDAVAGSDVVAVLKRIDATIPGAVVLPPFTLSNADALHATVERSATRLGDPMDAFTWLQQVGRVRVRVGEAANAIDLAEAVASGVRFAPTLAQFPDVPEERWAATSTPSGDGTPRTCILSLTSVPSTSTIAGLAIDSWTEVIPDSSTTTGIAVHFDAPSARPPQAWLLGVPPRNNTWTFDDVIGLLRQSLTRARQRAVGPNELEGLGQYLPATYLAETTDAGPSRRQTGAP